MKQPWIGIKNILNAKGYARRHWLNAGVESAELAGTEKAIGHVLPRTLRDMLLLHDGERSDGPGLVYGYKLLDAEEIFKFWRNTNSSYPDANRIELMTSNPAGYVKLMDLNRHWVPFAYDVDGNYFGVDFDPDVEGSVGQVIHFGRRVDDMKVLSASFDVFVSVLIADLERATVVDGRIDWPLHKISAI